MRTAATVTQSLGCAALLQALLGLTLNLLTTTIVAPPSNARKWRLGFNSAFKGLMHVSNMERREKYMKQRNNVNKTCMVLSECKNTLNYNTA
jgi:predicted alpha/beta hydrolase family esterase